MPQHAQAKMAAKRPHGIQKPKHHNFKESQIKKALGHYEPQMTVDPESTYLDNLLVPAETHAFSNGPGYEPSAAAHNHGQSG